jgi:hypothetical protein
MGCRRTIKGLSQVGGKADFSKNLRASPFNEDKLKDTAGTVLSTKLISIDKVLMGMGVGRLNLELNCKTS